MGGPMMVLSGGVAVLNLLLSLVIGTRLLRATRGSTEAPERWLALYFFAYAFVGNIFAMTAYAAWADPSIGLSPELTARFNAIGVGGNAVGTAAIYAFTYFTFRRDVVWARWLARAGVGTIAGAYCFEAVAEGFSISVVTGPGHYIGLAARVGSFVWMAIESFRYSAQSRKRMRVGLAEPLLTNRFLLFATWSSTTFVTAMSEVPARILYTQASGGGSEPVLSVAGPIILATITITMLLGATSAGTLFLTFFPTASYRRWIERGAATAQLGAPGASS